MYKILEEKELSVGKVEQNTLIHGDCLNVMPYIASGSIDAIITDLPYGTTACKWDTIIPFEPMWKEVKRVLKPNGVFITTASQPFTSALIMSNLKFFKYAWIWNKTHSTSFALSKKQPMRTYEDIPVFYSSQCVYNPQMTPKKKIVDDRNWKSNGVSENGNFASKEKHKFIRTENYPKNIININSTEKECNHLHRLHPTQKPVALYEYLIKTYTNEGETVLDICFGSCTTVIACLNTNRKFIGIEKDPSIFSIGYERIKAREAEMRSIPVLCDKIDTMKLNSQVSLPLPCFQKSDLEG